MTTWKLNRRDKVFAFCRASGIAIPRNFDIAHQTFRYVLVDCAGSPPVLHPHSSYLRRAVVELAAKDPGRWRIFDFKGMRELVLDEALTGLCRLREIDVRTGWHDVSKTTGKALLSLGSNIDAERNLRSAFAALRERFGDVTMSVVYRFPAVGFDGPDFLNAAAVVDSDLDPFALNDWLHALEDAHGRDRSGPRFGDRPLDIDIVFFDDLVLSGPGHLELPRDELKHAFVLRPLAEIAPDFVDPRSGRTLAALWADSAEREVACEVAFDPALAPVPDGEG